MATNSSFNTSGGYDGRILTFSWSVKTQSVQENTTVIEWTLMGNGGKDTSTYLTQNITVKIGDDVVYYFPKSSGQIALRKGTVVASGTHTITHTADGSKTFTVYVAAGIYEWGVNSTGTKEFVLPQIPRASTITAAKETVLGTACNIQWTPATADYQYELQFELGSRSHAIYSIEPGSTEPYTYTGYVLPLELAEEITAAKSAEVDVTLVTYNSNGEQIGEAQEAKLVVTVPEESTKPLINIKAITPSHANNEYTKNVFVQGKSKVQVSFDTSGQYGADVVSETVSIGGKVIEGDISDYIGEYGEVIESVTSDYLGEYGEVEITVTAVDSRGISASVRETIDVLPYSKPKITPVDGKTDVICTRCDADGTENDAGERLLVKAAASISALKVDDVAYNSGALWYRWKLASEPDSAYSEKIALNGTGKNLIETASVDAVADKNKVLFEGSIAAPFVFSCEFNYSECKTPGAAQFEFIVDGATQYMARGSSTKMSKAFTTGTLTQVRFLNWGYGVGTVERIQLEIGETATEYEPYNARTDVYDGIIDSTFDKANRYTVQIGVTDDVGESAIMTFTIFSEDVYWHRGDGFLALGMHNEKGGFQTKWDAHFYGGVFINGDSLENYIRNIIEGG